MNMAGEQYYSLFTEQGLELLREAIQNGTKLGITHMSFGDGGGTLPTPNAAYKKLINEVYRIQLNKLAPDPNNKNWLQAEAVISSAIGGFNIRELGLWAGNILVAYSNYPPTYKPNPADGTARIMTFRMILQIDNTANFELKIDADIVMATIRTVDEAKQEVIDYADETKVHSVESIDDLSTIINPLEGQSVYVKGYYRATNFALAKPYKGGANRVYVKSKAEINDKGMCINGWCLNVDTLFPEHYGAYCDDIHDDHAVLQKILDAGIPLNLNEGTYRIDYPLVLNTNSIIKGCGNDKTRLRKHTTKKVSDFDNNRTTTFAVIGGSSSGGTLTDTYSIDVDAILVTAPKDYAANYNYYTQLEDFTCDRILIDTGSNYQTHHNADFVNTGDGQYGWFFPYLCQGIFKNCHVLNNKYGIYNINTWMNTFERVQWRASNGVVFGGKDGDSNRGGTSTDLTACWVTDVTGGANIYAWNFYGINYSTMSSCGTDFVGKEGQDPAEGILYFENCGYTVNGFGSEVVHAKKYLYANKSIIFGSSWTTDQWFNKYGGQNNFLFTVTNTSRVTICNSNLKFMHDVDTTPASYYANQPGFAQSTWSSSVDFKHCSVYPKVTGLGTGRFSLSSAYDSSISFQSKNSKVENIAGLSDPDLLESYPIFKTNCGIQSSSDKVDFGLTNPNAFKWDTNRLRLGELHFWYSTELNRLYYKTGAAPLNHYDGSVVGREEGSIGTTAQRPNDPRLLYRGYYYFDGTLNKPIWWTGEKWTDATGLVV